MTHAISDTGYSHNRSPWSWRWFAVGPSTAAAFLVLSGLSWHWAGRPWVGALVLAVLATPTVWLAHHRGPGRLVSYLSGVLMALIVGYGAISLSTALYLQRFNG
jgi:hypothetical protein